jgi:GH15 family glucan-1,4-alpha-glucosidase
VVTTSTDAPVDVLFPPIADYGFLSNCEQSCLVAPDGSVEWLCLPRPDSPSVFGALLDRAAGSFRFGPSNVRVPQHRRYVPGTMVLETTWQTPTGWMIVQDFLAIGPVQREGRRPDYHRAPSDFGAVGALVRVATCISGRVEAVVNCGPLFNYGAAGGTWSYKGDGYDAMTIAPKEGDVRLELAGSIPLGVLGPAVTAARHSLRASRRSSRCPGVMATCRAARRRPSRR